MDDDEKAKPENKPYSDPQLNVRAFTSIGAIYGGAYEAQLIGNPSIDINVVKGSKADNATLHNGTGDTYPAGTTGNLGLHYPEHKKGEIGAIGSVYGGGYSGNIIGNPSINIGTQTSVEFISEPTHLGTRNEDYTYNATTKISTVPVQGANITGNVYGGGNAADIIGNATITIGTKDLTGTGKNGTKIGGDVFGGGFGPTTTVTGDVEVNIGANTGTDASPNYVGYAQITGSVYGGSAKGKVNATKSDTNPISYTQSSGTTQVNLYGGTIGTDLYGGGYGLDNAEADVYGPVTVTVSGGSVANVFGCNNLKGSPKQTVSVNITGTDNPVSPAIYTINSVYGGGNQAAYTGTPTVLMSGGKVEKIFGGGYGSTATVDGGTSVTMSGGTAGYVYGGGNLAPVTSNATVTLEGNATVNGDVFGGGNQAVVNGTATVNIQE